MNILKKWIKSWIFWLILLVICIVLALIDVICDLSNFGTLSLVSLILALIFFVIFLITRSSKNGIKRLLTIVICSGVLGVICLILSDILYYRDFLDILTPITWILFFLSGTVVLLKLVRKK